MDDKQRALRAIQRLEERRDHPQTTLEESVACANKIKELKAKYKLTTTYPLPWNHDLSEPWVTVNNVKWTTRDDFVKTFFGEQSPDHVTYFPSARGKTYFMTWLADLDSDPESNEEGWQIIDNWEDDR